MDPDSSGSAPPPMPPCAGFGWLWPWLVIVAVVAVHLVEMYGGGSNGEPAAAGSSADMELLQLELQARLSLGLANIPPLAEQGAQQWNPLAETQTGRARIAAACATAAMPGTNPLDRAAAMLAGVAAGEGSALVANELLLVERGLNDPGGMDEEDWSELESLGWFAESLRVAHEPAGSEKRAAFVAEARGFAVAMMGLNVVALGVAAVGFGLLVLALVLARTGRLRLRMRTAPHAVLWLQGFAIYLAAMVLGGMLVERSASMWAGLAYLPLCFAAGLAWPLWRSGRGWGALREIGLHRGAGVLREMGCGLLGYLAMVPVFGLAVLVYAGATAGLERLGVPVEQPSHPAMDVLKEGGAWGLVVMLGLGAVLAPLFEEIMFRGAMYSGLRRRWRWLLSGLAMGAVFGLVHPQGITIAPILAVLGWGFALIREWRGSLVGGMTAHAIHNGVLMVLAWAMFSL